MAGYTPWMAGGAAAAKRANEAARARHRAEQREEYNAYRAEARACGYEVEPFDEWLGETTAKARAQEAWDGMSLSAACYYGDQY